MVSFADFFLSILKFYELNKIDIIMLIPLLFEILGVLGFILTMVRLARDYKWYDKLGTRVSNFIRYTFLIFLGYILDIYISKYIHLLP